jgi:LPXTG-motif cell wall-anchored protein
VPGSAQVTISDADITTVEIDPNGAELVNPFLLTQLRIIKNIEGEGAELATLDFVFRVDCVQLTRRFEPIFATMDRPEQTEVTVEGLPVGALCTVFEIDDGGADEEGVRLVGVVLTRVTVPPEPPLTVDATNTFSAGQLVLSKIVDGPGAPAALGFSYQLLVTCERPLNDGTFAPFLSETVTVEANSVTPVDALIPIGSRCWAEEVDSAGATSTSIDFTGPGDAAIITFETPMITITATNTYDVGEMVINKVVQGDRAAEATQPFTFAVNCTLAGTAQPTVTVTITPPATSATVTGLSTGAECTVTETGIGGADAPAVIAPATVVIGSSGQQPMAVTATNTFSSDPPPPNPSTAPAGFLPATGPSHITAMAVIATVLTVTGLLLVRRRRAM